MECCKLESVVVCRCTKRKQAGVMAAVFNCSRVVRADPQAS